ncbi:MAG: hypothetical protein C0429_09750 [Sphingopyxis sp.]|nr:hypothetical protein [Sphingopyxis sp.]
MQFSKNGIALSLATIAATYLANNGVEVNPDSILEVYAAIALAGSWVIAIYNQKARSDSRWFIFKK